MKILRIILLTFISFFLIACGSGKTEQNEAVVNETILTYFASRDGDINESELAYLYYYRERHGFTGQINDVLKNLELDSVLQITNIMRVFDEIVEVIKADGVVTEKEKNLLVNISADPNNLEKDKVLGIIENIDADVETEMCTMLFLIVLSEETDYDSRQEKGEYLLKYIKQWGFNVGQVYAADEAFRGKNNIKITVPSDINRKMRVVDSVVGFIKSDGEVTEKEKEDLIKLAGVLEVDKEKVLAKL